MFGLISPSLLSEPKPLASIFLKRKPLPTKTETTNEPPTTAAHSVPSTSTISAVSTIDTTNKCSTGDVDSSQCKEKSAAEKEAANKAFKALFTGASSQKSLPTSNAAEALPAPWPLDSHVYQKGEDASLGVNFWYLPWPAGKDYKSYFLQSLLLHGKYHVIKKPNFTYLMMLHPAMCGSRKYPYPPQCSKLAVARLPGCPRQLKFCSGNQFAIRTTWIFS